MTTTPGLARRTMDENEINRLEQAGDTATLARALRNLIVVTDDATRGAQAAAQERQEYVPTTLHKDSIYRALDAGFTVEASVALRDNPYGFYDEADEEDPGEGCGSDDAFKAYEQAARVMEQHEDWNDLPAAFTAEQSDTFTGAAVQLVWEMANLGWLDRPSAEDVDTTTRGTEVSR